MKDSAKAYLDVLDNAAMIMVSSVPQTRARRGNSTRGVFRETLEHLLPSHALVMTVPTQKDLGRLRSLLTSAWNTSEHKADYKLRTRALPVFLSDLDAFPSSWTLYVFKMPVETDDDRLLQQISTAEH